LLLLKENNYEFVSNKQGVLVKRICKINGELHQEV